MQQSTQAQVEQYDKIGQEAVEFFKTIVALTAENKWEQNSDKNGFKIHLKPDKETGLNLTRGEGFLPYTIDQIVNVLDKLENVPQYDELCETATMIEHFNPNLLIFYQKMKDMFFVVSSRDFVILQKRVKEGNKLYIIGKSIEHTSKPPVKGAVRGDLKVGGWLLEEVQGGTQVVYITWADPKGNLPTKAINMASSAQGQVVEKLKKLMDKQSGKK